GKHVYTEKPLATSVERGRAVLDAAAAAGLLVGCAPDTFLGAGIETLRTALEGGAIGTPAIVQVRMLAPPPERWHPSPALLYAGLAGALLHLGPYGAATAVALAGPVRRVTALASRPRATGTTAAGAEFPIAEATRVAAVLEAGDGALTALAVSFDADGPARHRVEVTGSDGTLVGGDPNTF